MKKQFGVKFQTNLEGSLLAGRPNRGFVGMMSAIQGPI
jgi:hypothetical protein